METTLACLVYQTTPSPALNVMLVMQYIQSWGGSSLVLEITRWQGLDPQLMLLVDLLPDPEHGGLFSGYVVNYGRLLYMYVDDQ